MLKNNTRQFYVVFWVFFAVLLMVTAMQWATIFYLKRIKDSLNQDLDLRLFYFYAILWTGLVLVEWITYWAFRNKITEFRWIWFHLICLVLAFLLLPAIIVVITTIIRANYDPEKSYHYTLLVYRVRFYSFWSFVILGHIFFIIALVKALSKNKSANPEHDADTGFLDQIP